MIFRARQFEFVFPRPALVMGIVNVTPDSFSDGGRFFDPEVAIAHALKLVAQGAGILDIGGESTRPGATPVAEAEELRRVLPVIQALAGVVKIPISIDTSKPAVAEAALTAGASIVNDVGAHRRDPALWRLVATGRAGYVCMHAPANPSAEAAGPDLVGGIAQFFRERLDRLSEGNVAAEQVVLDVGIGFGKTVQNNLLLLALMGRFKTLERPLLLGVSRKSFIGRLLGAEVAGRVPASLACACMAVEAGVEMIRTHDVAETVQAIGMVEAVLAAKRNAV